MSVPVEAAKGFLMPLAMVPGMEERIKNLEETDDGVQVTEVLKTGVKVVPGMGSVVDNINRPGKAFSTENHARAEWSIFDAEVKGPSAGTEDHVCEEALTARAFARAELASASASVGPAKATIGLSADTGVAVSPTQLEAKVLGTGVSFGRKMGVSLFGTGFEFKLW